MMVRPGIASLFGGRVLSPGGFWWCAGTDPFRVIGSSTRSPGSGARSGYGSCPVRAPRRRRSVFPGLCRGGARWHLRDDPLLLRAFPRVWRVTAGCSIQVQGSPRSLAQVLQEA